ncbi:unnamed protein product [Caenorhabditis bovis]|uniref:non-specific serine/threonine protein kinase n=1 Tax=Caenorhabditis bovis TaxID=2654633 RepID=A0A8S1FDZ0_9PELO|nr:unnamed protein product [Caenorhabditis bovis]
MSMKRFGKAAIRIGNELMARSFRGSAWARIWPKLFPTWHNLGAHVVLRKAPVSVKQSAFRLARLAARNGRIFRPFASVVIEKNRFERSKYEFKKFIPIKYRKIGKIDMTERIRTLFGSNVRYNEDLNENDMPNKVDAYDFGNFLGQGCNAAVYSAKLSSEKQNIGVGFNEVSDIIALKPPMTRTEYNLNKYPLAIKLMFNYDHDRAGENHLWSSMGNELAPYPKAEKLLSGKMANFKPLPRKHPNVVRIMTAFVDTLKILPDAAERYPDALHTASWYESIAAEPKTMYVVMRRYRQTLHDYVWTHHRNYWTGRVMLAQLLEACTFLHANKVAQRDMKSDNILLQYDQDDEIPSLVIADFGCALATGTWKINYTSEDVYLGGNARTRAPEIQNAVPGPNVVVDFEMADTWAAGGLAYEIFTRSNPFYQKLDSKTYLEVDLPKLPHRIHFVARDVVRDLLKRNPEKRVRPGIAANAVSLSLFRFGEDSRKMMEKCGVSQITTLLANSTEKLGTQANKSLDNVLSLITAETIMGNLAPHLISRAERQLRATFLSRLNRQEIWQSLHYFFSTDNIDFAESMDSLNASELSNSLGSSENRPRNGFNIPLFKNVIRTGSVENGIVLRVQSN